MDIKWYILIYNPIITQYIRAESENKAERAMFWVIPKMETTYVLPHEKVGKFPLYSESAVN